MALVFKRKAGEAVMIGDDVSVTIRELHDGYVILVFDAPKSIPIDRLEVWRRKLEDRRVVTRGDLVAGEGSAA